jgi:F-type H+-transporting ATPase subunit epsilon
MSQYNIEIITPEREFFSGEIEAVSVTTLSGRIQLLAHHMSYASGLMPSILKIRQNGSVKYATVSGGFIEFTNNKATILADSAEWPEDIDTARATAALDRAKERLKDKQHHGLDKKRAQMALMRALTRVKISEYKKH